MDDVVALAGAEGNGAFEPFRQRLHGGACQFGKGKAVECRMTECQHAKSGSQAGAAGYLIEVAKRKKCMAQPPDRGLRQAEQFGDVRTPEFRHLRREAFEYGEPTRKRGHKLPIVQVCNFLFHGKAS